MIIKFDEFLNEAVGGIDVDSIIPTKKDRERAEGLAWQQGRTFYGNGAPFSGEASKMAKLIRDKEKLVRRAKAVVSRWGTRDHTGYSGGQPITENVWKPFEEALIAAGFSREDISIIRNYRE